MRLKTSVLIPTYRRPHQLGKCLQSLNCQTMMPDEVLVVWQTSDVMTKEAAEQQAAIVTYPLRILHLPEAGIVPAENMALGHATGDIILMIDDDAIAPPDWLARHLSHYCDPQVGAVGGPADNFMADGTVFPKRAAEPVGKLTWYGKAIGNMHDQPVHWRKRNPVKVDHAVGYNLSLRRKAFDHFEESLKPYWQMFEMDACLQVRARGFRVLFDFANVVEHYPTNAVYNGSREGDLQVKVLNSAFNQAFVIAKHSSAALNLFRMVYLFMVGSIATPGLLGYAFAVKRHGNPKRELRLLIDCLRFRAQGWKAGIKSRRLPAEREDHQVASVQHVEISEQPNVRTLL
ncbi:MAG: glycosyltransferase [Acidobacteriota bacterium]